MHAQARTIDAMTILRRSALLGVLFITACGGSTTQRHPTPRDGGADLAVTVDMNLDMATDAAAGCAGVAPNCFGNDDSVCCGQDPAGPAQCVSGRWMCGGAAAPGCNGTSCLAVRDGGAVDLAEVWPTCSPSCTLGDVCLVVQQVGGAFAPVPDGGCASNKVRIGGQCEPAPTFSCAPSPVPCAGTLSCSCAGSLCGSGAHVCVTTQPGQVDCHFNAP